MDLASKLERLDISMTKKNPEDIKPPAGPIKSVQFDLFSQFVTNDLSEVKRLLEQFENKSDGAFVRAAPDVPFESAAQAIGVCNAAGFASVAYLPE